MLPKPVTMTQVARETGLSRQTVGLALGERAHLLKPETRERVLRAASTLGYRRSGSAVAMRTGRTNCFALLLSTIGSRSILPRWLVDGIQQAMREHDLHLAVESLPDEQLTSEGHVPKLLREVACDGLLINYNAQVPQRMIDLIGEYVLPAIWLNSKQDADCVYPDDYAAAEKLTQRLIGLGHQRIAYVDYTHSAHEVPWHYSGIDRLAAYEQVMMDAGLSPQRLGSREIREQGSIWQHMAEHMKRDDRPTAVIGYCGMEARACLHGGLASGLAVPRDLSVTCFDNSSDQGIGIDIACCIIPDAIVGKAGVEMLQQKVNQPNKLLSPHRIELQFKEADTLDVPPTL